MDGLQVMGLALAIFLAAGAGIVAMSVFGLRLVGQALNPKRPQAQRVTRGLGAFACLLGLIASGGAGFLGISSLMFYALGPGAQ
jgi:hypothetical protein